MKKKPLSNNPASLKRMITILRKKVSLLESQVFTLENQAISRETTYLQQYREVEYWRRQRRLGRLIAPGDQIHTFNVGNGVEASPEKVM